MPPAHGYKFWMRTSLKQSASLAFVLSGLTSALSTKGKNHHIQVNVRWLLLTLIVWLAGVVPTWPAPFSKTISFIQPDGAQIVLWGEGDEFHAVFETLDGYTVVFDAASSSYHYAMLSTDGNELLASGYPAGTVDPRSLGIPQHLRIKPEAASAKAQERYLEWEKATQTAERWNELKKSRPAAKTVTSALGGIQTAPPNYPTLGTKIGLCLLIDFDDDPATIPQAEIINFLNGDNYTGFGNNGSVKQYFLDNSNHRLLYTNVVTVYIRIPNALHPKSYYNDPNKDCGVQGNLLIQDAVALLKSMPNYETEILPGFSNLSLDQNGRILACNVFYAGGNGGVWSRGLWPHSWALIDGALSLGSGQAIYRYQISNIGDSLELGTFCHENGHMLCGFPDIYDYDPSPDHSIGGAGIFCLMNSGGHGRNPVQICAYLKDAAGWGVVTELNVFTSASLFLTATPGDHFNHFYRYTKPGSSGYEYLLLENRHASGRDAHLPASGIAIWHIDEWGDRDNQSLLTNSNHANYEVTLIQADNQWHFQNAVNYGDAWDLYYAGHTGGQYSNEFSTTSLPGARWWDGTKVPIRVYDFSMPGPTMTFQYEQSIVYNSVNNELVGWGRNFEGETSFPASLSNLVAWAGGGNHAMAIQQGGQVIAWGYNNKNQAVVPAGLSNVVAVAAGMEHSMALKADGEIVVWGSSTDGQAAIPPGLGGVVAISAGDYHCLALKADGQLAGWGYSYDQAISQLPNGLTNVIAIASRGYHDLALTADGRVVAWGWNDYSQTNVPAGLSNVVAIAAGFYHSLALKADGTVAAWGGGPYTKLVTVPSGLSNVVAIAAGWHHNLALKANGETVAWGWGTDFYQESLPLVGFTNVAAIAVGDEFNLAQLSSTPLIYGDRQVQAGESLALVVPYQVGGSAFLQWYHNGLPVLGATNHLLRLSDLRGYQTGQYLAVSQYDFGSVVRAAINLEMGVATVQGHHIFYNNSAWDGNDPSANAADDAAVAPDKAALLPGSMAAFANYTSYSRGINGLMIDVANLHGEPTAADFIFKVGNNNEPATWSRLAVSPNLTVRYGAGLNGSDRITLIWPDNAIQKQWLEVTVLATDQTGLASPDVFYFGNAIGEAGNSPTDAKVDLMDRQLPRINPRTGLNPAPIDFPYDYDRDKKVDLMDRQLPRAHPTTALNALQLIELRATP